ncbi:hypothetical protein [Agromyces aureus]|uniref:Uncharacterized protein n=1 Tax=Agromyces aureus TaxID=453304 RepID=A0A191WFD4_9MICO|nr:hypothetical protein [Agromyces aureus]ANJ26995.1 hypothetical protein ATC03_09915 [Agromyces aureus]
MTSSQEPQLTRREMRERERLQEQAVPSSTPNPAPQTPAQAVPVAPIQTPTPQPVPAYGSPTQPNGAQPAQVAPYGSAPQPASAYPTSAPLPAHAPSAFAPGPVVPPAAPVQAAPAPAAPAPAAPAPAVNPAPVAAPVPPVATPAPRQSSTPERTLTRRELRAMLDGDAGTDGEEFDDLDQEIAGASAMDAPRPPAAFTPAPAQQVPQAPPVELPQRQPLPHQAESAALSEQPIIAPKPVGHWTAQLDAPVESAQPYDQMLSRGGVGRGVPTTTNALILPSLPDHAGIPAPITNNGNGEVIVTGSIDLPRSYGATGVHPSQIDSSDVDHLFDQVEDGVGIGAPVSATRAISTQSASKAVVAPPSKEAMNVPLVLAVTAGVLALGVVGTLVVGALTGLF